MKGMYVRTREAGMRLMCGYQLLRLSRRSRVDSILTHTLIHTRALLAGTVNDHASLIQVIRYCFCFLLVCTIEERWWVKRCSIKITADRRGSSSSRYCYQNASLSDDNCDLSESWMDIYEWLNDSVHVHVSTTKDKLFHSTRECWARCDFERAEWADPALQLSCSSSSRQQFCSSTMCPSDCGCCRVSSVKRYSLHASRQLHWFQLLLRYQLWPRLWWWRFGAD